MATGARDGGVQRPHHGDKTCIDEKKVHEEAGEAGGGESSSEEECGLVTTAYTLKCEGT